MKVIFVILFFLGTNSLFAEERKRHIIEYSFGKLNTTVSEGASAEKFKELYFFYDLLPLYNSEYSDRRQLSLYKAYKFQTSEIINLSSRLGYEFRAFSFLGIGGSYNNSNFTVIDVLPGDYFLSRNVV